MAGFQISGLVSGSLNWQTIVDQLIQLDSAPITKLETQQSTNTTKLKALDSLSSKLTALKTSVENLNNTNLYVKRSATSSSSSSTWSLNPGDGTAVGSYKINVSQLATSASVTGGTNVGSFLAADGKTENVTIGTMPTAMAATAGTFTVNGKQITVGLTDTLKSVLAQIGTATNNAVTASYNSTTDKIELTSTDGTTPIMLGASNDTSNFISAMQLGTQNNAIALSSSSRLGTVALNSTLTNAHLATPLSGLDTSTGNEGAGNFVINGVTINYNANTDSLSTIISRINSSKAGVTASYDSSKDQMSIVNTNTGDTGISMSDGTYGNFLAALNLTGAGATFTRGKNAQFTVNDGTLRTSTSNTLDATHLGITGLSVTANDTSTQTITVNANTSSATSAINTFISAYNTVQDYIESQTRITTSQGKVTTNTLTDNREIQNWSRKMRGIAFGAIGGTTTVKQLNDLGIDFVGTTNNLQLKDSSKLESALKNNASDVTTLFTSSSGFAANFKTFFNSVLGNGSSTGSLQYQSDNLTKSNKDMDEQILTIQNRLDREKETLTAQFLAMQTFQQKANTIMAQLSKSFA